VQARIASAERQSEESVKLLQQAAAAEDQLSYNEPQDWFFPVRHLLGAQLLQIHRAGEAEAVYREDLARNPANGWALYGLAAALNAQGKLKEAAQYEQSFASAWKRADTTLSASAY
jgi:tetratricopeptide (TPR) repeat protein